MLCQGLYCITRGSLTWNSKSRKTSGNGWFTVQTWYSSHVIHPSLSPSSSFSISPATFEASSLSKPSEFYKWNNPSVVVSFHDQYFSVKPKYWFSNFVQKKLIYHVNTLIYSLTSRCDGVFCSLTIIIASIISSNSFLFSRLSWSLSNTLKQTTMQEQYWSLMCEYENTD